MNTTETMHGELTEEPLLLKTADMLNRVIAKTIDLIIVIALYEIIPKVGYLAGISYLLIADGLFQGRSAGKRLIGLKVIIHEDTGIHSFCGFKESIIRNLPFAAGYILFSIMNAIPFIGWLFAYLIAAAIIVFESLIILGNEKGIRLGDELAKTRVVEERQGGLNV